MMDSSYGRFTRYIKQPFFFEEWRSELPKRYLWIPFLTNTSTIHSYQTLRSLDSLHMETSTSA